MAAIEYCGATPAFVDIDPNTFTMDVTQLSAAITSRTRAIVPVHLYGHPADMDPILALARSAKLIVIEDAAQAHGAEYNGRRVGSMGDMACFSFYPAKNLGAYGEGGMVVTGNPEYARTIRMLRDWGAETKYHHVIKGYNFRLDGIQGAVLRVKLRHLEAWTEARRAMWQESLRAAGVQTGIHYPTPVHLLPAYANPGGVAGQFPEAERAAAEVLSIPMFPELTANQRERVAGAIGVLAAQAVA